MLLLLVSFNVMVLIWGIGQVLPECDGTRHEPVHHHPVAGEHPPDQRCRAFDLLPVPGGIIVASFVWMLKKSLHKFAHELTFQIHDEGHSPLYMISTLFFAVIAFNILFYLIIQLLGELAPASPAKGRTCGRSCSPTPRHRCGRS